MPRRGSIRVEIEGMDKLVRKLRRLADHAASEETVMSALEKAAEPTRAAAEAKAPRRTGHLAENIVIERVAGLTSVGGAGLEVSQTGGRGFKGVGVFAAPGTDKGSRRAFYGMFQEFGTVHHAAQPFMRPAYDENKRRAIQTFRREMEQAIERAV